MKAEQLHELLLQALETELGGIEIYKAGIRCAVNPELKLAWQEYLAQTRNHERVIRSLLKELGLDAEQESPGRGVVRHLGESLLKAIEMARESGSPDAAQLVATECITLAETKDHQNWELIGMCAEHARGAPGKALQVAQAEVEDEEDEHLYHNTGWARELWIASLGLSAALPPPEEEKDVRTAIGAALAKAEREEML
jgi:rubrerythrin